MPALYSTFFSYQRVRVAGVWGHDIRGIERGSGQCGPRIEYREE